MEAGIADLTALAIILICTLQGAYRGLVLKIYSFVRIVLLLIVTMILIPVLLPLFPPEMPAREGIAFLTALIITAVALHILARILKIVDHIPVVNTVNKLGGAAFGFVIGLLLVWVILFLIMSMQELEWCHKASSYVSQSSLLMQFQELNPLANILEKFFT